MIRLATRRDLVAITNWLRDELEASDDDTGFFYNIDIINAARDEGKLYAMLNEHNAPIAFCVLEYDNLSPSILCVKQTHQRRGHGTAMVEYMLERAQTSGAAAMEISHILLQSIDFWEKLGFKTFEHRFGGTRMRLLFPGRDIKRDKGEPVRLTMLLFRGHVEYEERLAPVAEVSGKYDADEKCVYLDREWITEFPLVLKHHGDHDPWIKVSIHDLKSLEGCWYRGRLKYLANFNGAKFGGEIPEAGVFRMRHFDLRCGWDCYENRNKRELAEL